MTINRTTAAWRCALHLMAALPLGALATSQTAIAQHAQQQTKRYDIAAGALEQALNQLAVQSGLQVLVDSSLVLGRTTTGYVGTAPFVTVLQSLLANTELVHEFTDATMVVIKKRENAKAGVSQNRNDEPVRLEEVVVRAAIPEVLVVGSKILNMDIRRTEDDAQPYVIFEREAIQRSGAVNVEDFLRQRLPMNTTTSAPSQSESATAGGNVSSINLRGLGTNQTLILVDGRRVTSRSQGVAVPGQPDLNGIPIAAIERIEVLPTTASGIYGGSATGGVINIVLRRDYSGVEVAANYENTFEADSAIRRIDVSSGFSLEDGRTNVTFFGSYSDANPFTLNERRELARRQYQSVCASTPASCLPPNAPLGATPNIQSATLVSGVRQNLVLDDGTPLNSTFTFIPYGYAGTSIDRGAALVANAGRWNLDLADSAQAVGLGNSGGRASLRNVPVVESLNATVRRQFGSHVDVFLEASASENAGEFVRNRVSQRFTIDANASNNPFQQNIEVAVPVPSSDVVVDTHHANRRLLGGVIVKLPGEWHAEADYTWDQARFEFSEPLPRALTADAAAAIRNGTIDVLRDTRLDPLDLSAFEQPNVGSRAPFRTTLKGATLRMAGPVAALPAGAVTLSAMLERRDELFAEGRYLSETTGTPAIVPSRSQSVESVYLETRVPLVSERNRLTGIRELELQVAGRYDEYAVNGATNQIVVSSNAPIERFTNERSSVNPTLGLRYRPLADLMLRASYGTGFLPPSVAQLVPRSARANFTGIPDPRRGNESLGSTDVVDGGNPDLRPEESRSVSAGAVFTPRLVPDLRLSVDYTRIQKTDNIKVMVVSQILANESLLPGRVIRGPVPSNDPYDVGPVTRIDASLVNLAQQELEAWDVQLDYRLETRVGTFDFYSVATWQPHLWEQITPTSAIAERAGTQSGALKLRANGGLSWTQGAWTLGWAGRYFDSHFPFSRTSGARVPSQDYHDVFANVRFGQLSPGLLEHVELHAGVKNVFNKVPPITSGFFSPLGDLRLSVYYVTMKASF